MTSSDMGLLIGIISIFLLLGFIAPFIHDAFNQPTTTVNAEGIVFETGQSGITSTTSILFSVLTIFLWSFGNIPVAIDLLVLSPLRIALAFLLYRQFRGIGG